MEYELNYESPKIQCFIHISRCAFRQNKQLNLSNIKLPSKADMVFDQNC